MLTVDGSIEVQTLITLTWWMLVIYLRRFVQILCITREVLNTYVRIVHITEKLQQFPNLLPQPLLKKDG